ncbi:MAG UNVERIFIED_CONTAM: hypothetical protein LVR18_11685 [Planctomycetaceae bacterium]
MKYVSGRGIAREVQEKISNSVEAVREQKKKSRLAAELGELRTEVTDIAKGSLGLASTAGTIAVERTLRIDSNPARRRDAAERRAAVRAAGSDGRNSPGRD